MRLDEYTLRFIFYPGRRRESAQFAFDYAEVGQAGVLHQRPGVGGASALDEDRRDVPAETKRAGSYFPDAGRYDYAAQPQASVEREIPDGLDAVGHRHGGQRSAVGERLVPDARDAAADRYADDRALLGERLRPYARRARTDLDANRLARPLSCGGVDDPLVDFNPIV